MRGLLVTLPCIRFLPSTEVPPTSSCLLSRTSRFPSSPYARSTNVSGWTCKPYPWACWWMPVLLTPFSWKSCLSWGPEYLVGWLWILLHSSRPSPMRCKWLSRISCVPSLYHRIVPDFHGPPCFGWGACQGPCPISYLKLPHPLLSPSSWLQDLTQSQFTLWCKSTTPGLVEIPGILLALICSLDCIALQIPIFPVYPRKGPWVHADPGSSLVSGGRFSIKTSAYHIPFYWYILKYPQYQAVILPLTEDFSSSRL